MLLRVESSGPEDAPAGSLGSAMGQGNMEAGGGVGCSRRLRRNPRFGSLRVVSQWSAVPTSMESLNRDLQTRNMAERVGFEPTIPVKVCPLSRRIVSTAHAPLRVGQLFKSRFFVQRTRSEFRRRLLPTAFKERLQEFCTTACQDAVADFHFVVQLRVTQHLHY